MNSQEYENLLIESKDHLKEGRFRMALKTAKRAYDENPEDSRSICSYAAAKLESGFPDEALTLADSAVKNSDNDILSLYTRAWILFRRGFYESSLSDAANILLNDKTKSEVFLLHAKILAALGKYKEASKSIDAALKTGNDEETEYVSKLINLIGGYYQKIFAKSATRKDILYETAAEAFKKKEYWFSLWAAREIVVDRKYTGLHKKARMLEIDSLLNKMQYKEAYETAEKTKYELEKDPEFSQLYRRILKNYPEGEKKISKSSSGNIEYFENPYFAVHSVRCYDFLRAVNSNRREYLIQFDEKLIRYIGVEVIIENPVFEKRDIEIEGTAVWYLNDIETGRNKFNVSLKRDWKYIEIVQSWGTNEPVFWKKGTGKVLIMLDDNPVCAKSFDIRNFEIEEKETTVSAAETHVQEPKTEEESVEVLLNELNSFTGLTSVKQSLWDFVTYLKFLNERKKHGLKTTDEFSIHCVFTGNPGTGKTTVARKLGKIFKAMGLLRSGHIVEVDRAALVGQYVGETAQKTERAINDASGGILFVDEAYTLTKQGNQQDFGQEAIDILLKRMEDRKDDFVVIAAGYPAKMQSFITSNPGLRSRFTHFFHFDDYTPDELISIFRQFASEEEFVITDDSLAILKKEFVRLYRKRDESFGNARVARKYLTDIKLNVSRRLSAESEELPKEAFTIIVKQDVENLFTGDDKKNFIFNIDEDKLDNLLQKLDSLTGLAGVKKEINEIIKLTRYYIENGEDPQKNISGHLVFLGNPGTGKTTVARLFSEIYSALGILPKGHLVEVDRQALVGQYVGQTAIKTKDVIDSALGGTLFIDEAYSLLKKDESDFGRESIDTLIKRMEDDKGKFILIAAGYTDETNNFLSMNPGLSSRFYKKIHFDDYSPDELYIIAEKFLGDKKLKVGADSQLLLKKFLTEAYERRDKRFGNARFIRNITDKIIRNHLLFIAGLNRSSRTDENTSLVSAQVVNEILKESKDWIKGTDSEPEYILKELNDLTGLTEVKKTAMKLIASLKVAEIREKRGLKNVPRILHSVFYGAPGTGKATAVKIFGEIYKNMGILSKGHIVTVNKLNMSGIYAGQSKQKTEEYIQKAAGGILYIEDAEYLQQDFSEGSEILDALLEGLSENVEDIVYIISGNRKDFADEIRNNPILSKYFVNYFYFGDFEPRQLVEIAYRLAESNSYQLDEGALQLLMDLFSSRYNEGKTQDNARMVKDILYKSISYQEERLVGFENPSDDELKTIMYDDVIKAAGEY